VVRVGCSPYALVRILLNVIIRKMRVGSFVSLQVFYFYFIIFAVID